MDVWNNIEVALGSTAGAFILLHKFQITTKFMLTEQNSEIFEEENYNGKRYEENKLRRQKWE